MRLKKYLSKTTLLLVLGLLLGGFICPLITQATTSFSETIHDQYEYYRLRLAEDTSEYHLEVYDGIYNGDVRFGINYIPTSGQEHYKLMIIMNDTYYYLKSSKNTVELPVIAFEQNFSIQIINVYNTQDILKTEAFAIDNTATIKEALDVNTGLGQATLKASKPSQNSTFTTITSYIWIIGLALLGLVFALVMYKKSTASILYKPSNEPSNFDFNAFLAEDDNAFPPVKPDDLTSSLKEETNSEKEEMSTQPDAVTDIIGYLRFKGYPIDSDMNDVSEDIKNQMMMELMKLKDQNLISKEEYLKGVMAIWKK